MNDLLPCSDCGRLPTLSVEPFTIVVSCENCYDYCDIEGGTWHAAEGLRMFGASLSIAKQNAIENWNDKVREHSESPI